MISGSGLILNNNTRGIFAEFLVGSALDVVNEPRKEWDKYDFDYGGKYIEVKSSAYIQTWDHDEDSDIGFNVSPRRSWDYTSRKWSEETKRWSDCYVFCLFKPRLRDLQDIPKFTSL